MMLQALVRNSDILDPGFNVPEVGLPMGPVRSLLVESLVHALYQSAVPVEKVVLNFRVAPLRIFTLLAIQKAFEALECIIGDNDQSLLIGLFAFGLCVVLLEAQIVEHLR